MPLIRSDLIVPVRDRRQHRRVLTLKNVRNAIVVLVLAFIVVSAISELRGRHPESYGRLYQRTLPPPATVATPTPPPVVEGKPVTDQTGADPMLLVPAARGQWLVEQPVPAPAPAPAVAPAAPPARVHRGEGGVEIAGGPDGVSVVTSEKRPKPVLSGGIFKQPD